MGEPDIVIPGDYGIPGRVSWALKREIQNSDVRMYKLLEPYKGNRWRIVRLILGANIMPPKSPKLIFDRTKKRW